MSQPHRSALFFILAGLLVTGTAFAQTEEPEPVPFSEETSYDVSLRRIFHAQTTGMFTYFPEATDDTGTDQENGTDTSDAWVHSGDFTAVLLSASDDQSAAAMLAGAINSIAGGGTLLSFPAAIAWGLPSTVANATNAVAMMPGSLASAWAYRNEIRASSRLARLLLPPALIGGITGAVLLYVTPVRVFDMVVPWLVLAATLLILFQPQGRPTDPKAQGPRAPRRNPPPAPGSW